MTVLVHSQAEVFISKNSNLPIARVITQGTGSGACELWEQPLKPNDVIPMHWHLVEETITFASGRIKVTLDGVDYEIDADRDGTSSVLIPTRLHHEIRNIGDTTTSMLAFFPAVEPQIFKVQ
jgi:mannose-6-phosphate isomerase-like protein (cupin superfamily)